MTRSSLKMGFSSDSNRKQQQEREMKNNSHSQVAQESNPKPRARPYPVSARAYNKKDYEYLSTFPRTVASAALRVSARHEDVQLSREPSDVDSDLFTTSSSIECTSISSACSTSSSTQSCAKSDTSLTDMESNHSYRSRSRHELPPLHHADNHGQQHHLKGQYDNIEGVRESGKFFSSIESIANPDLQIAAEENTHSDLKYDTSLTDLESNYPYNSRSLHEPSPLHLAENYGQQHHHKGQYDNHEGVRELSKFSSSRESIGNPDLQIADEESTQSDLPIPTENCYLEAGEAPARPSPKVKSGQADPPAVLPKFGSWDTKNPSSGEAYTLIFKRLRDEKKAGAIPLCGSPTHPKAEEAEVSVGVEIKAKESLVPNAHGRNNSVRRAARTEVVRGRTRWNLCCKASVLGD